MARPNPRYGDPTPQIPTVSTPNPPPQTQTQTNPPVIISQGGAVNQGGNRGHPEPEPTQCYTVYGNDLQLTQAAVDYYKNIGVDIKKCGSAPTPVNTNLEQRVKELEQLSWTYPEVVGTASQRSNVDVWNHLSQWVWGHSGDKWQAGGSAPKWDEPEPSALFPMTLRLHTEQESRLTEAHAHRQSIEAKVEKKAEKGHSHGGGNGTDWGVVVMGVLAIVVILIIVKYLFPLLKGLKGIIPSRGGNGNGEPHGGFM